MQRVGDRLRRRAGLAAACLALVGSGAVGITQAAGQSAASAAVGSSAKILHYTLAPGGELKAGEWMVSPDGRYWFGMGRNGNLALYRNHRSGSLWSALTGGHWGAIALMQRNGDFVVYYRNRAIWSTHTGGQSWMHDAYLQVQTDGFITIYSQTHRIVWSSFIGPLLSYGSTGSAVTSLQQKLWSLGYWDGTADGVFGDATQQAVWALQKAAGIPRTGVTDPATWSALYRDVRPSFRAQSGNLVEVDLKPDLVLIIRNGKLYATLNTSTGGGYTYVDQGQTYVADTPPGVFHTSWAIDGPDTDSLGTLWRPRFFNGGIALHGDSYVPPVPVSHGCVRVSDEAINWIWAQNLDPIGGEVWVFSS